MSDDKVYRDIRVFRFKHPLLKGGDVVEFRSDGPVPIYNDTDKLLGFATLEDFNSYAMMVCAIDPACPERLDLELGNKNYFLDAILEYRGFISKMGYRPTIAHIKGLVLTTSKVPGQDPVDPKLGIFG